MPQDTNVTLYMRQWDRNTKSCAHTHRVVFCTIFIIVFFLSSNKSRLNETDSLYNNNNMKYNVHSRVHIRRRTIREKKLKRFMEILTRDDITRYTHGCVCVCVERYSAAADFRLIRVNTCNGGWRTGTRVETTDRRIKRDDRETRGRDKS